MEDYLQTEWPDLKVFLTSTTEQWAVIALQGPKAREVIAPLVDGIDLSPEAFPHMAMRSGTICGVPTRLFRVSFTGELGFEINVPSDHARAVWEAIWEAGSPTASPLRHRDDARAAGEKGYIIIGQETDGTVTPDDVGLAGMIAKAKKDFVGKRSLARPDVVASGRKQLVGLVTDDPSSSSTRARRSSTIRASRSRCGCSATSRRATGARIAAAPSPWPGGRRARAPGPPPPRHHAGGFAQVTVVDPVFFDPKGERINA